MPSYSFKSSFFYIVKNILTIDSFTIQTITCKSHSGRLVNDGRSEKVQSVCTVYMCEHLNGMYVSMCVCMCMFQQPGLYHSDSNFATH